MFCVDKIPSYVYASLESEGVDVDSIMLAAYCDMNADHIFCDTYIFATTQKIYVVSGTVKLDGGGKPGRIEKSFEQTEFSQYDVSLIEKLKVEEMLSSVRLTAKSNGGEYIFLTAMTNTCRNSGLLFVKYFDRMKRVRS